MTDALHPMQLAVQGTKKIGMTWWLTDECSKKKNSSCIRYTGTVPVIG